VAGLPVPAAVLAGIKTAVRPGNGEACSDRPVPAG
jgi:hypothetical protein